MDMPSHGESIEYSNNNQNLVGSLNDKKPKKLNLLNFEFIKIFVNIHILIR